MKTHPQFAHNLPGVGYWGERPDVALRINFADIKAGEKFPPDPLHYHKTRTTYFCVLRGGLTVEINKKEVSVTPSAMLEVEPMEPYRVAAVSPEGCIYVVVGSHNEDDRVEVFE